MEPVLLTGRIYRIWLSICRQGKEICVEKVNDYILDLYVEQKIIEGHQDSGDCKFVSLNAPNSFLFMELKLYGEKLRDGSYILQSGR